jgi:hypothetical protein
MSRVVRAVTCLLLLSIGLELRNVTVVISLHLVVEHLGLTGLRLRDKPKEKHITGPDLQLLF